MTQISERKEEGLIFEIVSARIQDQQEKKHVVYTLQIRHVSGSDDLSPSVIDRRYTHFLNLYNALKKEQPQLMSNIPFPKKALLGNFDNELISARSSAFEALLKHIASESKLRSSNALVYFLQDVETKRAKAILVQKDYPLALTYLENIFKLLNKVFTDRSPAVLIALCRLLACSVLALDTRAGRWADIAMHRYDGVSDSDLLELYVPLLQTCSQVWAQTGRDCDGIQEKILNLKKQGVNVNERSLLDEVNSVEDKIFKWEQ